MTIIDDFKEYDQVFSITALILLIIIIYGALSMIVYYGMIGCIKLRDYLNKNTVDN